MSGIFEGLKDIARSAFSSITSTTTPIDKPSKYLVGKDDELKDGQMKEVEVKMENKTHKVLLSRLAGEYYATGHLCPHYKARLSTGVLTSEGRLVCPWHAACFDVKTGDIEEAPSLYALKKFPLIVEDGSIFVMASEQDFQQSSRPSCDKKVENNVNETFVIIGGGGAGILAAESIRKGGFKGKVIVISEENHLPIDRIKLSKVLDVQADSISLFQESYLVDQLKIDFKLEKTVIGLDVKTKMITLNDNGQISYNKLLIATGGSPKVLPLPGIELENIFTIRYIDSNRAILKLQNDFELQGKKPKVVVIGASFIGMEVAAMMAKRAESVTVVGPESIPLERVLGAEIGTILRNLHEKNNIKFILGTGIKRFTSADDGKRVSGIELTNESIVEADIVILGVGISPNTEFLKGSLPLDFDGGISVDEGMRVKGVDDIFAAGDIARFPYFDSAAPVRIEHWDVALQQGRVAGHNMAITEESKQMIYDTVPFFFTNQYGKSVRYTGSTHEQGYDDIIMFDDNTPTNPSFIAYYIKGDRVIAVATMGKDPLAVHCGELFRQRKMLTVADIKSGKSPLDVSL